MHEALEKLVREQHGMLARRQLCAHGVRWDHVDHQIAARRWVERTPRVISTITEELTRDQRLWLAVLHAGPRSMLGGLHRCRAARPHRLGTRHGDRVGRRRAQLRTGGRSPLLPFPPPVRLASESEAGPSSLSAGASGPALGGVRRPGPAGARNHRRDRPAATHHTRASGRVGGQPAPATPRQVLQENHRGHRRGCAFWRRARRPSHVPEVLAATPGSTAHPEDRAGKRRWTDCEWDLPDGTTLVLEVDGAFHIEVRQQGDDFKRARRITTKNRIVVRCSAYELRHETEEVAVDLIALGVPGRVPDNAA